MATSNGNGHSFIDPKLSFSAILVAGAMLASTSAYIVTVRDSAANNQDRMNALQTTTNSQNAAVQAQMDSLSHRVDNGFKDMAAQLAAQPNERDVNNLARRVDSDDTKFTSDETRLGVAEQQIVKLGEDTSNLKDDVSGIKADIARASAAPLTPGRR